ncbi:Protein PPP5D1 [Plecturocebus cupreus]
MAVEERTIGRTGLEGGREWGLWEPSLSLPWLLGGVGGICTRSSRESRGNRVSNIAPQLCSDIIMSSAEHGPTPALTLWEMDCQDLGLSCDIRRPSAVAERQTHQPLSLPRPLHTNPMLTWWGMGSLDRGLRPSSGVVAMVAAAAMAEGAARGSTGSSGLCSCFTMMEHSSSLECSGTIIAHCRLNLSGSRYPSASGSQEAETTSMCHHAWLSF